MISLMCCSVVVSVVLKEKHRGQKEMCVMKASRSP